MSRIRELLGEPAGYFHRCGGEWMACSKEDFDGRHDFHESWEWTQIHTLDQIESALQRLAAESGSSAPTLTVRFGSMPESNGRENWTVTLQRKEAPTDADPRALHAFMNGFTVCRSEYKDRMRYEADRLRYLLGEIDKAPFILDYDADMHSGYVEPTVTAEPVPIDMVLHCPACRMQHIDAPDERTPDWKNAPHRSHLCHGCGHIWRPADVATNGVAAVKTRGNADSPIAEDSAKAPPVDAGGFSDEEVMQWAERHDVARGIAGLSDARCAVEDAASIHLLRAESLKQPADKPATERAGGVADWPLIRLGQGLVEIGEGFHEGIPALIFGKNGAGTIGAATVPDRQCTHDETLAVVTFANTESLDVVLMKLSQLKDKMLATSPAPEPADSAQAEGDDAVLPYEVRIGGAIFGKGVKLSTLVLHANRIHRAAFGDPPTAAEAAMRLAALQDIGNRVIAAVRPDSVDSVGIAPAEKGAP